jgi:lysophospholipase L1-like esterase
LSLTDSRYRKLRGWLDKLVANKQSQSNHVLPVEAINYLQQDGLKVTVALMKALAADTQSRGQAFTLMIFPNLMHEPYFACQTKMLKDLAEKEHFDYLDLTPSFLESKKPFDNFLQYHFSPAGHKLVAQQLLECLQGQLGHR